VSLKTITKQKEKAISPSLSKQQTGRLMC